MHEMGEMKRAQELRWTRACPLASVNVIWSGIVHPNKLKVASNFAMRARASATRSCGFTRLGPSASVFFERCFQTADLRKRDWSHPSAVSANDSSAKRLTACASKSPGGGDLLMATSLMAGDGQHLGPSCQNFDLVPSTTHHARTPRNNNDAHLNVA